MDRKMCRLLVAESRPPAAVLLKSLEKLAGRARSSLPLRPVENPGSAQDIRARNMSRYTGPELATPRLAALALAGAGFVMYPAVSRRTPLIAQRDCPGIRPETPAKEQCGFPMRNRRQTEPGSGPTKPTIARRVTVRGRPHAEKCMCHSAVASRGTGARNRDLQRAPPPANL